MALAIALHNIPEGIIIAAPIYAATGSRWKAMALATASVSEGAAYRYIYSRSSGYSLAHVSSIAVQCLTYRCIA
jgi:zinc transporter ZupT